MESKMNFEEAGYVFEISAIKNAASLVGTTWLEDVPLLFKDTGLEYIYHRRTFQRRHLHSGDWVKEKSNLTEVLPPVGMENIHLLILKILDHQIGISQELNPTTNSYEINTPIPPSFAQLMKLCHQLNEAYSSFANDIEKRSSEKVKSDTVALYYKPPILPLSASISKDGFHIDVSPDIETPVGTIGISRRPFSGIKKLTIVSGAKKRLFRLDRPFSLFVPTKMGFQLDSDGGETLVIRVIDK